VLHDRIALPLDLEYEEYLMTEIPVTASSKKEPPREIRSANHAAVASFSNR